ncbi:uncharacterized protein [Elaeis guineensis]|uniref:uncharacterized protein n=1 Tax=Elaeis guineensis var. tenera TaxID=51953 RepID=UPI003C6D7708
MATGMTPLNVSQSLVPIFSGQNYEFWRVKMRTFCISQDLWDLVDNGSTEERQNELKELYKKDTKALLMLQQAVSNAIFPRIANATKSHEAWIILKQEFNGDSKELLNKEMQEEVAIVAEAEEEEEEGQINRTTKKLTMVTKQTSSSITKESNVVFVTNMATLKRAVGKRQNNKQILLKKRSKKAAHYAAYFRAEWCG